MEAAKRVDIEEDTMKEINGGSGLSSPISEVSSDTVLPRSATGRTSGPTRRSTKGGWTEHEDDLLTKAVKLYNGKNWKKIAERFPGRSDVQCLHRWQKVLNPELVKGPWTKEEDDLIIELVKKYGSKKWSFIAQSLSGRIGKQCRERWHNHLNPEIKKHAWTKDEELALIRAHQIYGNKWAEIAKFLPGRADNSIKNHWNCSVKKKLDSYLASGVTEDLQDINAYDFHNYDRKEESIKGKKANCDPEKLFSHDRETDSDDCIDTRLGVSVLGVSNGRPKNLWSRPKSCKTEQEDIHSQRKSLDHEISFECISPGALSLSSSELGGENTNSQSTSYDSHLLRKIRHLSNHSPRPCGELSLSLSTLSDPLESPKRPRHCSSPLNGQSHKRSNFFTTSPQPKDVPFGPLGSSPVCCSTPPSHMRSNLSLGTSPEAILRTAAKNFKNTPSIIRKRTRETCKQDCSGNDSNSTCMSEVRSGSSNDSQDDLTSTNLLNVKWLSLSSPSLHSETDAPLKSLEKRLEFAFDLEWDSSQSNCSVPTATETDTMDCNLVISPNSSGVRSNQNFMLLGIGVNCNTDLI